jgi:hypothetical protein
MARSGSHERDQLLSKLPYAGDAAFNSRFSEEHDRLCLPNTRVDLLEKIITWSNNPDDAYIFWLNGMAGTGKTTIARTIAQTCDGLKRLGASFFFSTGHNDLNHATKFFTTIAVQLATNIPDLQESICNAIKKNHNIAHLSLAEQWKKLILQPLTNLRDHREQITLVIDALDECKGEKDIRLILRLFSESAILRAAKLRIFVTSRPETPVRLGFNHIHQAAHQDFILHNIPQSLIQHDMMVYFQTELENIRSYFSLPKDWPGKDNLDLLVRKADKLIIIAATICRFIRHSIDPRQHLSFALQGYTARLSPTKELDAMYTKVLIRFVIGNFEEELSERFRQIVGSIILLSDPLSSEALAKLLNMDEYTVKYTVNSLRSVLDVSESQDCRIQLLHPSFRDFLLDPQRCFERQFWIIEDQTHRDLFVSCITLMSNHLKRDLCNLQLPGALSCEVEYSVVEKSIPLAVNYACRYWVHHLRLSNVKLSDNSLVHSFLRQHFLHWLEALSLIRKMSDSVLIIRSLESIPTVSRFSTIFRLQSIVLIA